VPIDDGFFADSAAQRGQSIDQFTTDYGEHLAYVNDLVLESIDKVLQSSATPPVIVLVADHGSASRVDWRFAKTTEVDPAILLERTGILFAALTPERSDVFPDDISPVNVFRYLFDAYLGTELGEATPPPDGGQIPPVDAAVLR
jgi:hypothetical protein